MNGIKKRLSSTETESDSSSKCSSNTHGVSGCCRKNDIPNEFTDIFEVILPAFQRLSWMKYGMEQIQGT